MTDYPILRGKSNGNTGHPFEVLREFSGGVSRIKSSILLDVHGTSVCEDAGSWKRGSDQVIQRAISDRGGLRVLFDFP